MYVKNTVSSTLSINITTTGRKYLQHIYLKKDSYLKHLSYYSILKSKEKVEDGEVSKDWWRGVKRKMCDWLIICTMKKCSNWNWDTTTLPTSWLNNQPTNQPTRGLYVLKGHGAPRTRIYDCDCVKWHNHSRKLALSYKFKYAPSL